MRILGVSCYHHDSAAASLNNKIILGASHEERFTRKKYDKSFPSNTISWLRNTYEDWDFAAFYEESTYKQFKKDIKKFTRAEPVLVDHHKAHAMSSILTTDWDDCAVMVIDTVGGKFSTSLGIFENGEITWLKRFRYPNSLGLFYSSATRFLGFEPLSGESQVMAAAGYGIPKWTKFIKEKIINFEGSDYTLLQDLTRGIGYGVLDWDVAASVQAVFTDIVFSLTEWLHQETGKKNLAYAGGCALNCVTNGHLSEYSSFDNIAIQPAAGDAGASLGAAALLERPLWESVYLGFEEYSNIEAEEAAIKIINGFVVPVITGRAEFGPRALGNRSLLCAPLDDSINKLNSIKGRIEDSWRPYAPVVQDKEFKNFFDSTRPCPYMLFVADIKEKSNFKTHNNTARVQCVNGSQPFLYKVLEYTRQYGYPILINTSLNAKGKPMVNKKEDLHEIQLHN